MNIKDEFVYVDEVVDGMRVRILVSVPNPRGKAWMISQDLIKKAMTQNQWRLKTMEVNNNE